MFRTRGGKSVSSHHALNRGKGCGIAFLIVFFTLWNGFILLFGWAFLTQNDLPWWTPLFLLPFVAVGIFGIFLIRRTIRQAKGESAADADSELEPPNVPARSRARAPYDFAPKSRIAPFLITLFVCLFWNGIVSAFLFQGELTCFLIPFILVGVAIIFGVLYTALAMMNPRVELHIESHPLVPGEPTRARFEIHGAAHRFATLEILLEGEERATYRQGTTTHTATNVFYSELLTKLHQDRDTMQSGELTVAIPDNAVPSFDGNHNKIVWRIRVHGDIKLWPDVDDKFDVRVMGPDPQEAG